MVALDHRMQPVLRLGCQAHHLLSLCHQSARFPDFLRRDPDPDQQAFGQQSCHIVPMSFGSIEAAILSFMTRERVISATWGGCTTVTEPAYSTNLS